MNSDNGQVHIGGPRDVFDLVKQEIQSLENEIVKLVSLDSQNMMIACETISNGAIDITLLRHREVFESALKNSAASIILVHNHPSGSAEPSASDVAMTRKIARIGKILGVRLQDHVIIGNGEYTSLKARGIIS